MCHKRLHSKFNHVRKSILQPVPGLVTKAPLLDLL